MKPAAFFDIDGTLVNCQTHMVMYQVMNRERVFTPVHSAMLLFWYLRYAVGWISDSSSVRRKVYRAFSRFPKEHIDHMFEQACSIILKSHIRWEMKKFIDKHQQAGEMIFGISASLSNLCQPVCEALGITDCFSTTLRVQEGRYTGLWEGPIYEGIHKKELAKELADRHGLDLSQSTFYSDSSSDLPLLEMVGHPVAVCPSLRLRQHAKSKNWPIIED